jgi:hypothetical protein
MKNKKFNGKSNLVLTVEFEYQPSLNDNELHSFFKFFHKEMSAQANRNPDLGKRFKMSFKRMK